MLPGIRALGVAPVPDYTISRSSRFRGNTVTQYYTRTPGAAGNQKTFTISWWCKRTFLGAERGVISAFNATTLQDTLSFPASDKLQFTMANTNAGNLITTPVFRDCGSWYHFVVAVDTTQATSTNRVKIYVNGVQITAFDTAVYPAQNTNMAFCGTNQLDVGVRDNSAGSRAEAFEGYLADVIIVDGQALTPSSFGRTSGPTGAWIPIRYGGTYGTTGFKLNFSDNTNTTTIAADSSGNSNNFTATSISLTAGVTYDSSLDTPTNNWTVLNGADITNVGGPNNGGMSAPSTSNGTPNLITTTIGVRTGKWYMEVTPTLSGSFGYAGVYSADKTYSASMFVGDSGGYGYELGSGTVFNNASLGTCTTGAVTAGQTLMVALDLDNGKIFFGKDGTWENSGNPATGTNPRATGVSGLKTWGFSPYTGNGTFDCNFGQRPFAFTSPSGFVGMSASNIPVPTFKRGDAAFQVVTYTGTGSSLGVTGVNFQPDLVWIKSRSAATDHAVYDALRGAQARLETNQPDAEVTTDAGLTAFNANGFTVNTLAQVNTNTATYAAWCWDESVTAGMDIVTYTGDGTTPRSINHSLGVSPSMVIVKSRSVATTQWPVFHTSLTSANVLQFNTTDAQIAASTLANGGVSAVSSTTFTVVNGATNGANVNQNTATYVAYLFSEVTGYSKFGKYTGNASTTGPFVWCGFRPRFVLIKRFDSTGDWTFMDTTRSTANVATARVESNLPNAEATDVLLDFVSNGFKIRDSGVALNASAGTYVYAAFAEVPHKYANAR